MSSRRVWKATVTVLAVAVTARLLPLFWTPYPFNPDGFMFAAQARDTIATGTLTGAGIGPHGYVFPTLLAIAASVTGVAPLWLAQPSIAVVGALPPVLAVLLVWRCTPLSTQQERVAIAATAAGLTLALEGIYLRRTVTVSYEVLGLLFVVLLAIGSQRVLRTRRLAWVLVTATFLLVLPITHHLSTFMAALTLVGLVGLAVARDGRAAFGPGLALLAPFWLYIGGYYALTQPPYAAELATKPGLFVAWVIVLGAGAQWLTRASARNARLTVGTVAVGGFSILGANAVWGLFPGTATTPPQLLVYVAPLTVLAALACWGLPLGIGRVGTRAVVAALLVAPIAWVGFAVTAGVDPVYADFARRGQTFVHLASVVCAGVAIPALVRRWSPPVTPVVAVGLPLLLCFCALASLPLAFAGLEALAYQGTTTPAEFETATFAATTLGDDWTSDDHVTRVARNYYETGASPQPAYSWLQGNALRCSTVMQRSWQTVGAQRYPSSPLALESSIYTETSATNHVVYTTTSPDPLTLVVPRAGSTC
ncbi:sodium/phosphate symporter [Natrinema gelatinilyticum]|uniref:sodium/phosphate symporter n=1 Tax=Natrinema gelatinilyticum TaxID=2961571 RepID=UPI0020C59553|nr:sodium/phosphate symporter [Natrinema gelatinilyticum]